MSDEETELRALLERAVPQLPAPAQRLERVRARVRRRARRRAAGLSVVAVTAVAAAGLLLPGVRTGDRSADPGPPAVTTFAPAGSGAPSSPAGPAPTSESGYRVYRFPSLTGLRLQLPLSWYTLQPPGSSSAYAASQQLGLPDDACAHPLDGFCTPLVRSLGRDGVLMSLQLEKNKGVADKVRVFGQSVGTEPVVSACRHVGGTEQMGATIVDGTGSPVMVVATVCLDQPTDPRRAQVRDVLMKADFN